MRVVGASSWLAVGQELQLTGLVRDATGASVTGRAISWSTSDVTIATVSSSGLVRGIAPGTATISASVDGHRGSFPLIVAVPAVGSIVISPLAGLVGIGEQITLTATVLDSGGRSVPAPSVTWLSSNPIAASVTPEGVVTGLARGTTVISASSGGREGTASIAVAPPTLATLGLGAVTERYTAEVSVYGRYAYTSSWSRRGTVVGNAIKVWDVSGGRPVLVDSLVIDGATTTGDVQVVPDARLLAVATERTGGSLVLYDLADPAHPTLITRYSTPNTQNGVHTAELQRVNGTLYAFLCIDQLGSAPARLTIADLTTPSEPREVFSQVMGNPFVHDVFVRDGLLFTALWQDGMTIWDIGGGGRGGSPSAPIEIGNIRTVGGAVHNVWWFHDPLTASQRYAFIGEEGAGAIGSSSSGDIHVVDVGDMTAPREVAFYHVGGAGTHNFSVDERSAVLYAAYYNGGVRAIDVRGDLGGCESTARSPDGRCDLTAMGREMARWPAAGGPAVYVWGVQQVGGFVYASDMLAGLWKLDAR
ncbi:MAG: Ig-like domain-containing protein [Gemmatimonadota bacterium]|nr:Ig-like domain-containing protein [Gemmatimonadota bacterium]